MPAAEVLTFVDALTETDGYNGGRSVLLGNGFSIDFDHTIFRYDSLFEEAQLSDLTVDKVALFDTLNTRDFERVMELLKTAAAIADLYASSDPQLSADLRDDADAVKRGLSDVIAAKHPHNSLAVADDQADLARGFLSNFGRIFTLNYDLLLYWVLNRSTLGNHQVQKGDGFEWPTAAGPYDQLVWKLSAAIRGQRVFYLHGGLHLFVEETRQLHKIKYSSSASLVDQIRERLDSGHYFLAVTEATSDEKAARIDGSAYLRYCSAAFADLSGTVFMHGVSMSQNDDHILGLLERVESQVQWLYVGLHNPTSTEARQVIARAEGMQENRKANGGRALKVRFYDSATAHVWR